jgi:ferredoxin
VAEFEERAFDGLRVRIDRSLCVGFGDCIEGAPVAFQLDGEGLAVFLAPHTADRAQLLAACDSCPVDAITVWDYEGRQLVP